MSKNDKAIPVSRLLNGEMPEFMSKIDRVSKVEPAGQADIQSIVLSKIDVELSKTDRHNPKM